MAAAHRVVIVGGGFGGLYAARGLGGLPVEVTLLDRRNFHLFQPLLYQVATGGLSPANIAAPLRSILRRQRNARVLLAQVEAFDLAGSRVLLEDGEIGYDSLVVATGARHHYFGHPEWEAAAPGLKTLEDATTIRRKVLMAFEEAERQANPERRRALLTFVVVGGGPTGVELAGAVAEMARWTLRRDFRDIRPESASVILIEGTDRVLGAYPRKLSEKALRSLGRLGVTLRLSTQVIDVRADRVVTQAGGQREEIASHTILWSAGVQASPLGKKLADAAGAKVDRAGRVLVGPDLTLPGRPEVFAIGDMANFALADGKSLPGVAPVAMQQGSYVANVIGRRLMGKAPPGPFQYRDRGNMATIGRAAAVADLGWVRLSGYPAWTIWLFVHLMYLVAFENRLLVLMQWAWNYFTRNRSARLITGENSPGGASKGST